MKWNIADVDLYMQSKEYVDTAVIPLIPMGWESDVKTTVAKGEFITLLSLQLERQFKGRVILFPSFTYLVNEQVAEKLNRLKAWKAEITKGGIEHIFYLTADPEWKQFEADLDQSLLWMPALPLEHIDDAYKDAVLKEQIEQLMTIFMNSWKSE